jgi:uncharacterized protein (TIGR03437 family)
MFRRVLLCLALARCAGAHGFPTPVPNGPIHVQGSALFDSTGQFIPLRGANLSSTGIPAPDSVTFGILRLRWNFNTVRIPVNSATWRRDGQPYLDHLGSIVKSANDAGLVAVLANIEDAGLPTADTAAFWKATSAFYKDTPLIIFDVFDQPASADWQSWLNAMQLLVDAIRSTGAAQCIAVSAPRGTLDFQGFTPDFYVRDPNVVYEVHPFFDHALTDEDRDKNFGFLARTMPVYAGSWGLDLTEDTPACRSVPANAQQTGDLLFRTLAYFDSRAISWTAGTFEINSLIRSATTFDPTMLDNSWTCGVIGNPQPGMGQILLLWLTGDPLGFGTLAADQIANTAGGPAGPVVPGEILTLYGFMFGPAQDVPATIGADGKLPTTVADIRVFFDGEAAPIFTAGPYEITVQVPYSLDGKTQVGLQIFYRQIPSNTITLPVVPAAPRIVTTPGSNEALALNQDGSRNSTQNPAGSILVLFASGYGQTSPAGVTGKVAQRPYPAPNQPVTLFIAGTAAELLYAAETPGLVGLLQINARIPVPSTGKSHPVPATLKVGNEPSLSGVTVWLN